MDLIVVKLFSFFINTVNTSLKASIFVLIILLIRKLMNRKLSARFSYIIWFILILRLISPDIYYSSLSLYKRLPEVKQASIISIPAYDKVKTEETSAPTNFSNEKAKTLANTSIQSEYQQPPKSSRYSLFNIVFWLWIIGLAFLSISMVFSNASFIRKIKKEPVIKDINILNIFDSCKRELAVKKNIPLLAVNNINTPALAGYFIPKILIPKSIIKELNPDDLRYIFLHELGHYKRKDILVNWVSWILTLVHWFNPFIWIGFKKMREDCELSCDSFVLNHLNDTEAARYGNTLISLAHSLSVNRRFSVSAHFLMNKSQIKKRIYAIKSFNNKTYKLSALAIAVLIIASLFALVGTKDRAVDNNKAANNIAAEQIKADTQSSNNTASIIKSDIVVYNSHPQELYKNGISVTEASAKLMDKLKEKGLEVSYLEVPKDTERPVAYPTSRNLIINKVENFKNKILLDIHIDSPVFNTTFPVLTETEPDNSVKIILGGNNYTSFSLNKEFADSLLKELKKNNSIESSIVVYEQGKYNQDLSPTSLLIEIGTGNSTSQQVESCINALVLALKDIVR